MERLLNDCRVYIYICMSTFQNTSSFDLLFLNEHIIYEKIIKCTVKDYEFNLSYNPDSLSSGSIVKDFVTGSDFKPYVTTVGLYNDSNDLIAVAKFGQPIPVSKDTDITYLIKFGSVMHNWLYNGEYITDIDQLPSDAIGFIYLIRHEKTGKFYIGKKNLQSTRNIPLGKKALAERTDKRLSKKKKVIKESDWKTYMGSEPTLKEDIKTHGDEHFHREILHIFVVVKRA